MELFCGSGQRGTSEPPPAARPLSMGSPTVPVANEKLLEMPFGLSAFRKVAPVYSSIRASSDGALQNLGAR